MDSRPTVPDNQYISQLVASPSTTTPTASTPVSWSRVPSGTTTPRQGSTFSLPENANSHVPGQVDLRSNLYPQQSLFNAQLLDYNKLISPGRGGGVSGGIAGGSLLQSPLPPIVPVPNIHAAPRPRSSSRVSNKGKHNLKECANQQGHGHRTNFVVDKFDREVTTMGKDHASKASNKHSDHGKPSQPRSAGQRSSKSPTMPVQASSSVPSTPHQRARNFSTDSREVSPNATQNHSPRSAYSETNASVPSLPQLARLNPAVNCQYETALVRGRRRMPYNLGTERLEKIPDSKIKSKLSENEARKLTTDMRELYDRLKPTERIKGNREKLVLKLEAIFNNEWPGHNIGVHLFGSSGNKLFSDDSDVDICITTDWKELENVCKIAELLAKRGMDKVVCVGSAKVPIVKIWDSELGLACDMNVNNTLALDNTRMILTYVEIDERVRPLAMIVKYWTRRRIINDAAFGGTLSSYTWICLIIAFLQLRSPPVLPALHQLPYKKRDSKGGFADDLDKLRGFGRKNKESLGELLFHFFRFYAHEFDYDKYLLSVRVGSMVTKKEKKWDIGVNMNLCVEEPFNTVRNLSNTADDTSFKGLHQELRRAFDLISEGKLKDCCEQYEFPKEEERVWQKPVVASRPVILRASSQQGNGRGGRGGNFRGGRGGNFHRNGNNNNNRRASSSVAYDNNQGFATPTQPAMTSETQWYAQQQQYYHPDLMNSTLNALQMQEHTLRFHLYTQSQAYAQHQALAHAQRMQGNNGQPTDRSRAGSFDNPPLTAPARPELYMYPMGMTSPYYVSQAGLATLPSSPAANGGSEFRRSLHRNGANADSSSSSSTLRSQSQPAVRTPMPGQPAPTSTGYGMPSTTAQLSSALGYTPRHISNVTIPSFIPDEGADSEFDDFSRKPSSTASFEDEAGRSAAYQMNETSSSPNSSQASGIPAFGDLGHTEGPERLRLSTELPQSILDRRMRRVSRSPSPLGHARAFSMGGNTAPLPSLPFSSSSSASTVVHDGRPVIVNGSAKPTPPRQRQLSVGEKPAEPRFENPLRANHGLGINGLSEMAMPMADLSIEPLPSQQEMPVVVNGSNSSMLPPNPPDAQSFNQRIAAMNRVHPVVPVPYAAIAGSNLSSLPQMSPRQRVQMQRQQQNGLASLDLAIANPSFLPDMQHLSPVYENRTPSPTVVRRFDGAPNSAGPSTEPRFASQLSQPLKDLPKGLPPKPQPKANAESKSGKEAQSSSSQHRQVNGTNGHVRGAKSESDNASGWQKPKSRKKGADTRGLANGINHGEQPPKHDADRKGG